MESVGVYPSVYVSQSTFLYSMINTSYLDGQLLDGSGFATLSAFKTLCFVRSQQVYARHAVTRLQVQVLCCRDFLPR